MLLFTAITCVTLFRTGNVLGQNQEPPSSPPSIGVVKILAVVGQKVPELAMTTEDNLKEIEVSQQDQGEGNTSANVASRD